MGGEPPGLGHSVQGGSVHKCTAYKGACPHFGRLG